MFRLLSYLIRFERLFEDQGKHLNINNLFCDDIFLLNYAKYYLIGEKLKFNIRLTFGL